MRIIGIMILIFCGCVQIDVPSPVVPQPVPAPAPQPAPSPPGNLDFSKVAGLIANAPKDKARKYADGWAGLAWALERGDFVGKPVKTTGDLRTLIAEYETLNWQGTDIAGFCPGISAEINAALLVGLGKDDRPLNPGEAAAAIKALGEACHR